MKVLWFSNTPAGAEEILNLDKIRGGWLRSLNNAVKNEVELSIAFYYSRYAEPFKESGVWYIPICKKNWKLNILRKKLFGGFIDKEDLPVYIDIIQKVKPDIIHIHGTENSFGCLIGAIDVPIVLSYQGSCTVYNHKYFSGIERRYAYRWPSDLFSFIPGFNSESYWRGYNKSCRSREREIRNLLSCRFIIGRTDWDRRITRILAPHSTYFHNDEVLRNVFYMKEWKKSVNKRILVHSTVGEALFKGFETLCHALSILNERGIEIEWRVAGVSKTGRLNQIVKRKLKANYPKKGLVLFGNLNESELVEKMLESDIYVMPSHIENSPNSLCEAMILGMPCITTIAGGSSSLLKDKEEGLVIQNGDPWSMAGAVIEMASDTDKSIHYGKRARERALLRHNMTTIVKDLIQIYSKIKEPRMKD